MINKTVSAINSFEKDINDLLSVYSEQGIKTPISFYTNFRDGLNHFSKLYSNQSNPTIITQQQYAIYEHLNRATRDSIIYLIDMMIKKMCDIKTFRSYYINIILKPQNKKKFKLHKDNLKNISLNIRIGNMHLETYDTALREIDKIINTISELFIFLGETNLIEEFWKIEYSDDNKNYNKNRYRKNKFIPSR